MATRVNVHNDGLFDSVDCSTLRCGFGASGLAKIVLDGDSGVISGVFSSSGPVSGTDGLFSGDVHCVNVVASGNVGGQTLSSVGDASVGGDVHCVNVVASGNVGGQTLSSVGDASVGGDVHCVNVDASGDATVNGTLNAHGLMYPLTDNIPYSIMRTDGAAHLALYEDIYSTGTLLNTQSTNLAAGDHVKFDATTSYLGGATTFLDLTTPYTNATNVASIGRLTLTGGKKYKLKMSVDTVDFSNSGTFAIGVQLFNSDTNTAIGAQAIRSKTVGTESSSTLCVTNILAPLVNTRYELRILAPTNLQSISGATMEVWEIYSSI